MPVLEVTASRFWPITPCTVLVSQLHIASGLWRKPAWQIKTAWVFNPALKNVRRKCASSLTPAPQIGPFHSRALRSSCLHYNLKRTRFIGRFVKHEAPRLQPSTTGRRFLPFRLPPLRNGSLLPYRLPNVPASFIRAEPRASTRVATFTALNPSISTRCHYWHRFPGA